jgi:glycosyltransferase involved in cell wall biosynthesis
MRTLSGVTTCLELLVRHLPRFDIEPTVVEWEKNGFGDATLPDSAPPDPADRSGGRANVVYAGMRFWHTPHGYHRQILRKVNRCRPHLVVCSDQFGWNYLQCLASGVPVINIAHLDSGQPAYWAEIVAGLPWLRALVGVSDRIAARLRALGPTVPEVVTIPYGIEVPEEVPPRPGPAGGPPVLLYVGRLEQRQKRVHDLAPFLRELDRHLTDYRMVIVGDGPERARLEEDLRWAGPRVTFTGCLDKRQVLEHYRRAHFLMLFSNFEGLPLALLEAMAHGLVPVVTDIPSGVGQVVRRGANGYVFPVGEPARAARLVAGAVPHWAACSRNAWQSVRERFSVEVMCRNYAALFHRLGHERPPQPIRYVDACYPNWPGKVARRVLPISVYCGLLGRFL